MLQVASHPTSFGAPAYPHRDSHRRSSHNSHSHSAPAPIQLPRTLARPPFAEIQRDALAAAAPELASIPDEFIRHGLRGRGPAMLAGISTLAPSHLPQSLPRSRLPPALSVPLRSSPQGTVLPTHALAICLVGKNGKDVDDGPTTLFPVHAVVLAAHCTKLPCMPRPGPSQSSHSVALPVLPLALPSPPAFALIHGWLYSGRLDTLLSSLIPFPTPFLESLRASCAAPASSPATSPALILLSSTLENRSALHALATHLCATSSGNLATLMGHAGHIKELWTDLVALGICDAGIWTALDVAWEVVLGAMNLAAA